MYVDVVPGMLNSRAPVDGWRPHSPAAWGAAGGDVLEGGWMACSLGSNVVSISAAAPSQAQKREVVRKSKGPFEVRRANAAAAHRPSHPPEKILGCTGKPHQPDSTRNRNTPSAVAPSHL
jgi:hypothetical protein